MSKADDRLVEDITRLGPTLFAATVAGSAFLYSISLQFEKNGLATSDWIEQVHVMSLAGMFFILSFVTSLVLRWSRLSTKSKEILRGIAVSLFVIGLILLAVVSLFLWVNTL